MLTYMLDTNTIIYTMKNRPAGMQEGFNRLVSQLCISSITAAELCFGVEKSAWPERNRADLEDFFSRLEILPYGLKAAYHYGNIRFQLQKAGKIIGGNDIHIAAHARSEGLVLIGNNLAEFQRVEGLRLENWVV